MATRMMKKKIGGLDYPMSPSSSRCCTMWEFLWACRMTVDMLDLNVEDFHESVKDVISAGDFIELSECAQLLFT